MAEQKKMNVKRHWFFREDGKEGLSPVFTVFPGYMLVLVGYGFRGEDGQRGNGVLGANANCFESAFLHNVAIDETRIVITNDGGCLCMPPNTIITEVVQYSTPVYDCECKVAINHKNPKLVIMTPGHYLLKLTEGAEDTMLGNIAIEATVMSSLDYNGKFI